jgi:hypothetical protein
MTTISSLESLCVDALIASLAKSRPPFVFGSLAPLPEALAHLLFARALSLRGLCDGVLSGALGPALTVLDLSEARSLESVSGRLFEQVPASAFVNLRHFALDCTPAYAAAPSLLPASAGGPTASDDSGGSGSGGVCLADPSELLAFANKVIAGAVASLERFEVAAKPLPRTPSPRTPSAHTFGVQRAGEDRSFFERNIVDLTRVGALSDSRLCFHHHFSPPRVCLLNVS